MKIVYNQSNGSLGFTLNFDIAPSIVTIAGFIVNDAYNDVFVTFDGSSLRMYINDNTVDSTVGSINGDTVTNANTCTISDIDAGSNFYKGTIEELRFYDKTLSADNIQSILDNSAGLKVKTTDLEHQFVIGDILLGGSIGTNVACGPITLIDSTTEFRITPVGANLPKDADVYTRVGHNWDTDRQSFVGMNSDFIGVPSIFVLQNITSCASILDPASISVLLNENGAFLLGGNVNTIGPTFNVSTKDQDIFCDATLTAITVNLPATPLPWQQHSVIDSRGVSGNKTITIQGNGNTINGATSTQIKTAYTSLTFKFNPLFSQWNII